MSAYDLSLGCILIGVMLNIWLYGFSVLQTHLYYTTFRNDGKWLKIFVAFLFIIDTMNSVFDAHFIYDYLVTNFGNLQFASRSNVTFTTDPVMTGIMAFSCQLFFAWRVRRLNKGWIIPASICILSFASLLGAIGSTIGVSIVLTFEKFQSFQVVVIIWLLFAALADLTITVSLIYTLRQSRTGFKATDDLITRLIRITLQTGLLTTTFAIIDLILFLASPTTLHLVFNLPLAKLYINSLLSTLNARQSISNVVFSADGTGSGSGVRAISGTGNRHSTYAGAVTSQPVSNVQTASHGSRGISILARLGATGRPKPADAASALENGVHIHTVEERFEEKNAVMHISESTSTFNVDGQDQPKDLEMCTAANRPHSNSVGTSASGSSDQHTACSTQQQEPVLYHPFASPQPGNALQISTANAEHIP
ncbi:hypothetical protein K437DRAFT_157346 [Tilletiaria anomala UBC 951]|uniref:DUF6534 domain-containing protein n=1 Tax=Tilletiaria anomala (strain ATCC 24038 / CBS 436.72 / UBC 951) TaxID=1037660 RepID=A0A066VVX6_TILAU|nr:uncharacterized protein K437DRAFT_157346 [Tilletiaria anomala UBC 951]KDN42715.1 hypothetical protein K437DRAFT_157346 [Tilletiaria anomala UBC 951]